jgi:cation diffusion facilitator CzcD-associated flavoprotein CzcO
MNDSFKTMVASIDLTNAEAVAKAAAAWLDDLASVIAAGQLERAGELFTRDASWRDVVALTWDIRSVSGHDGIAGMLGRCVGRLRPASIAISPTWAPAVVTRADRTVIEMLITFETGEGEGEGVVRLAVADGDVRGWTVLTALAGLRDRPEREGPHRPEESDFPSHFGAPNWLDKRTAEIAYAGREPAVLIIGAGQAGLSLAARLRALDVDALVIESDPRVGDNWRNRYHSLWLHNEIDLSHLPYMPFPSTWPAFLPKDKMASWLENYAEAMEVNVWTRTRFAGATWDDDARQWTATVERDGFARTLRPRHIVVATGVSGAPRRARVPGLEDFTGKVMHSSEFTGAEEYRGEKAIVFGVSNSGCDIAQDLQDTGCDVTMVQRGSITVVSLNPGSLMLFALYRNGWPLEVCDLLNIANPGPASLESNKAVTRQVRELDRDLIAGLTAAGFKTDYGHDESGYGMKYFRQGGGHYLDVGCCQLIIDRKVGLLQYDEIDRVVPNGVRLRSGETRDASLIILATGYHTLSAQVAKFFGAGVAERVGPVWGLDAEGELNNMWRPTPQPGLWFHAGSLYQCRVFSKYLALQIAAREASPRLPA